MSDATTTRARYIRWGIVGVIILAIIIAGLSTFGAINGIRNEGISKEQGLMAQYSSNKNELSTYTLQFDETLGVAQAGADKLNSILSAAVQGRYDNDSSLKPGTSGALFSAIQEAYPDLTATSASYAKVQDLVISGRAEYRDDQDKLIDMTRSFKTWQQTGIIKHNIISALGFPDAGLTVTENNQTYTGQAALDRISRVILSQSAQDSYNSGTVAPLVVPSTAPAPTATATPGN
jgi:hypothetical protein